MKTREDGSALVLFGSAFEEWADPWARLGLWVSLWDNQARLTAKAPAGHPFWDLCTSNSGHFAEVLRQAAQQAMSSHTTCALPVDVGGIAVIAAPLCRRRSPAGCVVACALTPDFIDGEAFARFCSRYSIDAELLARFVAGIPVQSQPVLCAYARIIAQNLATFASRVVVTRDVSDLSTHLAQAYEELNLLYRVSTNLSILRAPVEHFERLCGELIAATAIESVAAVLDPPPEVIAEPTVVLAGPCPADHDSILRLYWQARSMERNAGAALVLNNAGQCPGFEWAAGWLRQLLVLDLARGKQGFGGLIAVNHTRQKDFGSEEVQLLNALADRSSAFLENVRLYGDLEQLFLGMMHALVSSIDAKDPYTCGHSQRVAWLSRHISTLLGVDAPGGERVYLSGLLHDVGKIGIPEAVLGKTGRLTPEEYEEMKRHPAIGAKILDAVRQVGDVIPGVLHHHERMDGKGYPAGLAGDRIPLLGRIICLADSFDAITTSRTYRVARPVSVAVEEIRRCSGSQFDPGLVELLLREDLQELGQRMTQAVTQPIGHCGGLSTREVGAA